MPSRRSKRRLPALSEPTARARGRRTAARSSRATGLLLLLAAVGCAGLQPRPTPTSSFAAADRPFLVSPLQGYPFTLALERAQEITATHRALVETGAVGPATRGAAQWLAADPGFHPALVLLASVDFGAGRWQEVTTRLEPVVAELPRYGAAQLLVGRTRERLEEIPAAIAAYAAVADQETAAAASVIRLRPRAAEILGARIDDALARGRLDVARQALDQLTQWAPGTLATLRAELAVGEAASEPQRALAAARRLAQLEPGDRALAERLADLEIQAGDAGRGLQILEELAASQPTDGALAEHLAEARFRWRLQLLPAHVRDLAERAVLSRADFASLVFWLFPTVRHGRVEGATIASDILESPVRREIARVVNLGLLAVDPDLHLFHPERAISRQEALDAFLLLLRDHRSAAPCGDAPAVGGSAEGTCTAAHRCGLIAEVGDCLPSAPLSGAEAMALARHGGGLLGENEEPGA